MEPKIKYREIPLKNSSGDTVRSIKLYSSDSPKRIHGDDFEETFEEYKFRRRMLGKYKKQRNRSLFIYDSSNKIPYRRNQSK